ncbi:MAG: ABC transporter permease [Vicinamibacterales bacterium]
MAGARPTSVRAGSRAGVVANGLAEAGRTVIRNPLRTSLAGLAMAAAVATTVLVQTGLDGLAQAARASSARAFGSDSFLLTRVATGTLSRRELADRFARHPNITRSDVRFLDAVGDARVIYAATTARPADVSAGPRTFDQASINGAQATLFAIRDLGVAAGRPLTRDDDVRAAQVVVAGDAVVTTLFPGVDPLGQRLRIAGRAFTVVGVLAPEGAAGGQSLDRQVWMPLTAFERAFGAPASLQVFGRAAGTGSVERAEDQARVSMRARRHLGPAAADTFDIVTPEASRSFVARITEQVGAAAPPISLMALIAALVVVANTTLVSVTERTREIGVRRAIGATRASVLVETLAESCLIAVAGGAAGVAVAGGILAVAGDAVGLPLSLGWPVVAGNLLAAGVTGIAAGWYPARRATRLDVVAALRSE